MDKYSNNALVGHLQIPISDKTVVSELSGDFILPDYQPEIKRLLRVGAEILPPSKYIGDRDAEMAGSIDYYVYYVGSDDMLYCAPISAEYKINVPIDGDQDDQGRFLTALSTDAEIAPDMISGRVTAPRKLSIKCRLKSRIRIFGNMPLEDGYSHGEDGLQVLRSRIKTGEYLRGVGEMLHVTDEMICDSREGEVRVVSATGKILMNEISSGEGCINCRGDVFVKLLLCREDEGMPYIAMRKLPFTSTIEVEGVSRGDSATAKGSVCELGITVEDGRIGIDTGIILEAQAAHIGEAEYVKDVYSVSRRSANGYKTVEVPREAVCLIGNFTLSDSLTLEEAGIAHGAKIIDACGNAWVEEYRFDGDKCIAVGKTKFSLLTEKDGEFSYCDVELPFNYRTGVSGDMSRAAICCDVVSVRARADGERVGIDAEIGVSGSAYGVDSEAILIGAAFGDEITGARGEIVVCYPSDQDTLWSVAKRYGADAGRLREANSVPEDRAFDAADSLENINFLVI